jgi:hypothetical protein
MGRRAQLKTEEERVDAQLKKGTKVIKVTKQRLSESAQVRAYRRHA